MAVHSLLTSREGLLALWVLCDFRGCGCASSVDDVGSGGGAPDEVLGRVSLGRERALVRRDCGLEANVEVRIAAFEGARRTREMGGGAASSMEEPGLGGGSG